MKYWKVPAELLLGAPVNEAPTPANWPRLSGLPHKAEAVLSEVILSLHKIPLAENKEYNRQTIPRIYPINITAVTWTLCLKSVGFTMSCAQLEDVVRLQAGTDETAVSFGLF